VRLRSRRAAASPRRGEQPVTALELFFDLVFVFAVTQLSHRLLDHLTTGSALGTLLLLVAVWRG
jgi:low temperature requirement protein LtrA